MPRTTEGGERCFVSTERVLCKCPLNPSNAPLVSLLGLNFTSLLASERRKPERQLAFQRGVNKATGLKQTSCSYTGVKPKRHCCFTNVASKETTCRVTLRALRQNCCRCPIRTEAVTRCCVFQHRRTRSLGRAVQRAARVTRSDPPSRRACR